MRTIHNHPIPPFPSIPIHSLLSTSKPFEDELVEAPALQDFGSLAPKAGASLEI